MTGAATSGRGALASAKRVVVKVGTNALTNATNKPDSINTG